MDSSTFSDDLRRYLLLLWRWAWLLVLATLLAGGAAYFTSKNMTPVFQASTNVLVNEAPGNKSADYTAILTSERLAKTYVETMTYRPVLEGVANRLGMQMDLDDLAGSITVQPVRDTQIIKVMVEHTDPQMAAAIANALVAEFSDQVRAEQAARFGESKQTMETQLANLDEQIKSTSASLSGLGSDPANDAERNRQETSLAQYRQTYATLLSSYEGIRVAEAQSTATVVQKEPAIPPVAPVRPRVMVNTLLAAVVGMMLAVGVVLLIEAMDDTLKGPDEITRLLNVPVLGIIASHDPQGDGLITSTSPRAPVAEAFRALRTNVQFSSVDTPLRTLLVTSPMPKEGKSTVSSNLAVAMAQGGRKVVIVDADMRRPRLHRLHNLPNRLGLSNIFLKEPGTPEGALAINGSLQETSVSNLQAITSGSIPPNPAELLASQRMSEFLDILCQQADMVILDTPPLLAVTDASVLAPRVDGVLLVVRPGETKLGAARQAAEQIRRVGGKLIGVVLNAVEFKRSSYYNYHYRYYYYAYSDSYGYGADAGTRNGKTSKSKKKSVSQSLFHRG